MVGFGVRHQLIQCHSSTSRRALFFRSVGTVFRNLAGLCFGRCHVQNVAGFWCAVQAKDLYGNRWASFIHAFTFVVDQRADFAPLLTNNEDIAALQRTSFNQNRRNWATAHVKLCLDHSTLGGAIWVSFQFEQFRLQRNRFEQFIKALACDCRDFDVLYFTGHLFNDDRMLEQIRTNLIWVRSRTVTFVDRNNHRHVGRLRVSNRFDRLWHHGIVRRDNQNDDVRDLRTAGTHGRKRRVTRCVEERQNRSVISCNLIRTNVLRDTASFASNNFGVADRIQKGCFAVVNVTHDRDDRWATF